jgi:hypothetical protein
MSLKILFIFFLLSFLCSCSIIQRKIYAPTQTNTPSLQEKNDHSFSVTVSTPSGFDLNGGYALTNRLAIIGGLFSYRNRDSEERFSIFSTARDSSLLLYKHKGFIAGIGSYFPLLHDKSSLFLSFFGSYTSGSFEMNETLFTNTNPSSSPKLNFYKSDIKRWALQGSLHFYTKNIHQTLTTRYNHAGYFNVHTDYTSSEQTAYNFPPLAYPKWSSFLDFAFDTKIFFSQNQKLGLQVFGSATARVNEKDYDFYHYPFRLGAGLVLKSPFKNKK